MGFESICREARGSEASCMGDKIVAIIQARMASSRLPGKVLKKVDGKSILQILVGRLRRSKIVHSIMVATTEEEQDDVIVEAAGKLEVAYYRGSGDDALQRYVGASKNIKAKFVVRVTADNPLTDPILMDELVKAHLESGADYTHCVGAPLGTSTEVVNSEVLETITSIARAPEYREHVTFYLVDHPELFRIHIVDAEQLGLHYPEYRLTVDTIEDLELMRKLYQSLGDLEVVETEAVIAFLKTHPEIREINAHVEQGVPRSAR